MDSAQRQLPRPQGKRAKPVSEGRPFGKLEAGSQTPAKRAPPFRTPQQEQLSQHGDNGKYVDRSGGRRGAWGVRGTMPVL